MASKYETREQWLEAAVVRLSRLFKDINIEIPKVRVSIGWPSKGGTSNKSKVIGQCWSKAASKDKVPQIFISPTLGEDLVKALGVLAHELIHAWDDCVSGHKGKFVVAARAIGLEGKMTATEVGPVLRTALEGILKDLGELPHAPLLPGEMEKQRPKQSTRMIKLVTPECCDYTVRTTQKWIDEGLPQCPHGVIMEVAD